MDSGVQKCDIPSWNPDFVPRIRTCGSVTQILLILFIFTLLTGYTGAEASTGGPASCMVLVTSTEGGTVSPFGANTVPSGSPITFSITPMPGYEIDHVMVDMVDKGPVPILTISPVTHDLTVHVIFGPKGETGPTPLQPEQTGTPCPVQPAQQPAPYRGTERPVTAAPTQVQELDHSPSVITVGKSGADFTRIQDAITSASPGKTIQIEPGRYDEQLIITRPLAITGKQGADKPLISAGWNGSTVLIAANQVSLSRLNITGAGMDGNDQIAAVSGAGIKDLSLEDCEISDSQNGLMGTGSENLTITGCNISNINRNGITLKADTGMVIRQTTISGCRTDLWGENLTDFFMNKTQINDAAENGVFISGIVDSEISGDIISGNSKNLTGDAASPGYGIRIDNARNVTITDNQIVSNQGVAFRLDAPSNITVAHNTLRNNAAGFSCTGDVRETNRIDQSNTIDSLPILYYEGVTGKTIEGISPGVLYLVNCSDMTVRNIVMKSQNEYGIVAKGGRNLTIQNTSVSENLNQNILLSGVAGGTVTGTTVHNSSRYGLGISDSKDFRIAGNKIRDNGIGVAVRGFSSGVNLTGNTFSGDLVGFQIQDGCNRPGFGELTGNQINRCKTGIDSEGGGGGMIRQNRIWEAIEGMNLSGSQGLQIEENMIEAGDTGVSLSQGNPRPDNTISSSRATFGNRILRNSITAAKPLLIRDSSEWIYGNTFVLNDFNTRAAPYEVTPDGLPGDSEDSWGGFTQVIPDLTEPGKSQQTEQVETSNTWDTGERVRYTYGNATFSGYLGNHWSKYTGKEIGASGVGDTPYTISGDNIDRYPLTGLQNQYETGGGGYLLELEAGWNTISTPSVLTSGHNTAEIFRDIDSSGHSLYSFTNGSWIPMKAGDPVQPLHGYWLYATSKATVPLIFDPGTVPEPVHLVKGWNVIGFPGIQAAEAGDALSSLDESWSYVMGYNATTQRYDSPIFRDGGNSAMMYPSRGYWIHLDKEWSLQPITG